MKRLSAKKKGEYFEKKEKDEQAKRKPVKPEPKKNAKKS